MAETCPKCGYAGVEADTCPRCRGCWGGILHVWIMESMEKRGIVLPR